MTAAMKLRHLLFARKAVASLDSVFKTKDITLTTKFPIVKAIVFPVVMYRFESGTIKNSECQELMLSHCDAREDS